MNDLAQERLGPFLSRIGEEMLGSPLLDDVAAIHEDHPVGHFPCEPHLMGHADHRDVFLGKLHHYLEHLLDHLGIQRAGRLVEHDQGLLGAQGTRDGDPLLLPSGKLGVRVSAKGYQRVSRRERKKQADGNGREQRDRKAFPNPARMPPAWEHAGA